MTTAATSPTSPKPITTPPSILFPLGAAVLAYFISEKSIWGAAMGLLAGALFNEAAKNAALKVNIVHMQGGQSFSINYGGEALAAIVGTPDEDRFTSPHIQVGDQVLKVPTPALVSGTLIGLDTIVGGDLGNIVGGAKR
jgi:hypothetical protein